MGGFFFIHICERKLLKGKKLFKKKKRTCSRVYLDKIGAWSLMQFLPNYSLSLRGEQVFLGPSYSIFGPFFLISK